MTIFKECLKCHRMFEGHKRATVCPDCKRASVRSAVRRYREKNRDEINAKTRERLQTDNEFRLRMQEQARRRYAEKHPRKEHYCIECGTLLQAHNAKRCPRCAHEKQLEDMREWARKKRAEIKAEKNKQAETTMNESVTRAKQVNVKIEKCHRQRELDARQKAAQEEKRIAAGVDMLKAIYARRQALKRRIEERKSLPSYPCVYEGDCPAWTRRDWW